MAVTDSLCMKREQVKYSQLERLLAFSGLGFIWWKSCPIEGSGRRQVDGRGARWVLGRHSLRDDTNTVDGQEIGYKMGGAVGEFVKWLWYREDQRIL